MTTETRATMTITLHGHYDKDKTAIVRPRKTKIGAYFVSDRAVKNAERRARLISGDYLVFDGFEWNAIEGGWLVWL